MELSIQILGLNLAEGEEEGSTDVVNVGSVGFIYSSLYICSPKNIEQYRNPTLPTPYTPFSVPLNYFANVCKISPVSSGGMKL